MTQVLTTSGITGTDNIAPVYDANGRWTVWSLAEIYNGQQGAGRYVPKINDYVYDHTTAQRYKCVSIDPTTMIAALIPWNQPVQTGEFSEADLLLGVGPGTQSDTYRVYINKAVIPHTLAVDARLKVNGSMVTSCRIFKGSELNGTARVISSFYDQTGQLIGQVIPLELVAMPQGGNLAVKSVPVCYTTEDLVDGEVVTAVFYSDVGHVVSRRQLLVENTAFIRSSDSAMKYVTDISLESPFLSEADPLLIQYPINVPVAGLNLMGVVHYSDGTTLRMPVDGTKFTVMGLANYVATIVGQKAPLVLKYSLSPGEIVYGATMTNEMFFTKNYRLTTERADGIYSNKLFGYPVWIDSANGYRMDWWLYNLDRQVMYHVTPHVKISQGTRVFDPLAYGINQRLSVVVDLKDVNGIYKHYNHVQAIDIVLAAPGNQQTTNWTIGYEPGQNPPFGRDNYAESTMINQNFWKLKIDLQALTQEEWLRRLYFDTKPLVDTQREAIPPTPNFFALVYGTEEHEYPISQWNSELVVSNSTPDTSTLLVKFFLRTTDNDLQLAIAGLPVRQSPPQ